ncbi:MAG: hypothetical protein OXE42_18560 [Gammaproteobacteria bacterium]|nr:hypothetical protein [Gammaproteobacteria bacterium]
MEKERHQSPATPEEIWAILREMTEDQRKIRVEMAKRQEDFDRRVYGAVAYIKVVEEAEKYAARQGLFVIRATGSSASIINPAGFKPKRFDTALKQS